jgi:hypothetical protein
MAEEERRTGICVHVCMDIDTCTYLNLCVYIYLYQFFIYIGIYVCIYTYVSIHKHVYIHICIGLQGEVGAVKVIQKLYDDALESMTALQIKYDHAISAEKDEKRYVKI